jgi:hypothetical protein
MRQPKEALARFAAALEFRRVDHARDPSDTGKKAAVAETLERMAEAHIGLGALEAASAALAESHAIREEQHKAKPMIGAHRAKLGESHLKIGLLHEKQGNTAHARDHLASARAGLEEANREPRRPSWTRLAEEAAEALARLDSRVSAAPP